MTKIVCVADLHGNLPQIEPCDILLIAGDICPHAGTIETERFGTKVRMRAPVGGKDDIFFQSKWLQGPFKEWLETVPAKRTVGIFGNHDFIGERSPHMVPSDLRWDLLHDSFVIIDGLKIYGSPYQPRFYDWAYNLDEPDLAKKWEMIPEDTDILVVHGPPHGYGDLAPDLTRTGSESLTMQINKIKPILSVHGHIHCDRGLWHINRGNKEDGIIVNACVLNEAYQLVHNPFIFKLVEERISLVSD